jgi:Tol biopolymer transport system component
LARYEPGIPCQPGAMIRRVLLIGGLAAALLALPAPPADALPGRLLLVDARLGIELFDAGNSQVRKFAWRAASPAFGPRGKGFAYIREGGCFRTPKGCYTEYAIFVKSLAEPAAAPGRQIFGWQRFFVRSLDVAPDGHLVFSAEPGPGPSRRGKGMEIYASSRNGSRIEQLTHNGVFENDVAVSPDGRRIAFSRRVRGRGQIFTMSIDGGQVRRVTHDGKRDRSPAWSPDGRRITYISQPGGAAGRGKREIYSILAKGRKPRRLTFDQTTESSPVYSPDGRWIAFLRLGELWVMRADGAAARVALSPLKPPGFEGEVDWAR